jgi:hypothetical protein
MDVWGGDDSLTVLEVAAGEAYAVVPGEQSGLCAAAQW